MPIPGSSPPIPGITATNGVNSDMLGPMALMMLMKGMNPGEDTTARKIEQVIALLREIGRDDPRIGPLIADSLRLLVEGPGVGQTQPAAIAGQSGPVGGPGGVIS